MEPIDEQIDISIKEDEIKELRFILNTGTDAKVEYFTELINGELEGIIISSIEPINIKIMLGDFQDIVLYQKNGYYGQEFLSLKNDSTFSNGEKAQVGSKWILNDSLKCIIDGNYNAQVLFVVRYK